MDTELMLELHKHGFPLKIYDDSGGIESFNFPSTRQLLAVVQPDYVKALKGKFMAVRRDCVAFGLTKDSALGKLWLQYPEVWFEKILEEYPIQVRAYVKTALNKRIHERNSRSHNTI